MIKSITVTNHRGDELLLDFSCPEQSGLIVKSITGLGSDANVNTSSIATSDGEVFNSARMKSRDIVITFIYDEQDPESSRLKSYKFFPIKKKVRLAFKTGQNDCYIEGYVEKHEITVFSEQAYGSVTITCPDPYFYSTSTGITSLSGTDSEFEFPFYKEIDEEGTIEMSQLRILKERSVYYTGNIDTGVVINIHLIGLVNDLVIYNVNTRERMTFDDSVLTTIIGSQFKALDDIKISTVNGDKYVMLVRDGVSTNIVNAVARNSDWFVLSQGDNVFTYSASVGEYNVQMEIQNKIIYEGI